MRHGLPIRPLLTTLALMLVAATAPAQTSALYATSGSGTKPIYVIQNGVVTNQIPQTTGNQAFALAVASDIRTVGYYGVTGTVGQQYTLGGVPVGAPYVNNNGGCCFLDGTTDGTYNYASGYNSNQVWRAGLDWSNLTPLFNVGYAPIGITYDGGTNSLWVGQYNNSNSVSLFQYALNGTLLSSFSPALPGGDPNVLGSNGITALAYDAADQTLWFSNYSPSATLYQYSRSGVQLSSVDIAGIAETGGYILGAEFQLTATPEPASLLLFGTGLVGMAGIAHRRRRQALNVGEVDRQTIP